MSLTTEIAVITPEDYLQRLASPRLASPRWTASSWTSILLSVRVLVHLKSSLNTLSNDRIQLHFRVDQGVKQVTTPNAMILAGVLVGAAIVLDGFLERRAAEAAILECVTMTRTAMGKNTDDLTEREFAGHWLRCAGKLPR